MLKIKSHVEHQMSARTMWRFTSYQCCLEAPYSVTIDIPCRQITVCERLPWSPTFGMYMSLKQSVYFDQLEYSYSTWYVDNHKLVYRPEPG